MHHYLLWNIGGVGATQSKVPSVIKRSRTISWFGNRGGPIFDPACRLHMHVEEEISEEEIVGWSWYQAFPRGASARAIIALGVGYGTGAP